MSTMSESEPIAVSVDKTPGVNTSNNGTHNRTSTSSRGYHHHPSYHNNYHNGYNNNHRHFNNNKNNYYQQNHHGGNYHHQNNRRYNNYRHQYQNNNSYSSYNNNHFYNNYHYYGSNQFYNNYSHPTPTPTFSSPAIVSLSPAVVVASPNSRTPTPTNIAITSHSKSPITSNGHAPSPPPPPVKLNTLMDYWPSTGAVSDVGDGDSFSSEGPSSIDSQVNSHNYISSKPRRPYNGGYNSGSKATSTHEPSTGRPHSVLTAWSSNSITPPPLKITDGKHIDKEYDLTQRGKFFLDGFPSLAALKVDPDELVKSFKFGEMIEKPFKLAPDDCDWASLSEAVWEKFTENQQTTETFRKKMELWRDMSQALRVISTTIRHYRHYGLQVVGSTMSGFGSNTSDVDMCLLVRRVEIDQQGEAIDLLHQFWGAMRTVGSPTLLDKIEVVHAKIPLMKCRDPVRNLEVDLNCNNYVGIRNTQLLYFYAQQDWRLKPLALVVKLWAKFHDINDAKTMSISSYSLVLMVIHFLQCGVSPPVLPCLHKLYPQKFMFQPDILETKQFMNETIRIEPSKNTQPLGELLVKFFEYYAIKFDYRTSAISVRQGGVVSIKSCQMNKSMKNDQHQWKQLCIEEPFDHTNTARSVYDRDTFDRIRGIFFASWQRIYLSRELESVFTPIAHFEAREIGVRIRT